MPHLNENQDPEKGKSRLSLEGALSASEIRYRRLLESVNDGVLILDAETGIIVDMNPFLTDLLGYPKERFIEKTIWETGIFKDIIDNKEKLFEWQQKGYVRYEELPIETAAGRKINVEFICNGYLVNNHNEIQCHIRDINAHKPADNEWRNSEAQLHALLQAIPDLVWLKDAGGVYLACNPMFERLYGAKEVDMIGKTDYDFVDRELADFFREHDRKAMEAGKPTSNEEWLTFADDGHKIFSDTIKTPMYDENGNLIGVLGIGRDITERKLAEDKLKESELRFEQVAEGAREWIWEIDREGLFTYVNPVVKELLGYDPDELIGIKHFYDFFEPEHKEELRQGALAAIARKESISDFVNCNIHKDGRRVFISTSGFPILDEENNLTGYRGIDIDITERLKIEEALRESEERYRTVADFTYDWEYWMAPDGKYIYISPSCERITGYLPEDFVNDPNLFSSLVHPDDHKAYFTHLEEDLRKDQGLRSLDFRIITRSGQERWLGHTCQTVTSPDGKWLGRRANNRDITEQKLAEEKIKKSNEQLKKLNSEKDKFFSIIAHDLKSPFYGFLNLTELMSDSTEVFSREELVEYSKLLNEGARNLYKLLENLLEWSQVQKGAIDFVPKDSDLSKMVSQSIETIYQRAKQKRISIINEVVNMQKVYADEKMIGTVLRNLLSNAVKFTRKDGKTIIRSQWLDDNIIEVSVEDDGIGIPEKDINRLFKIEEKVSSQGTEGESSTGLGLLLCKEFIEMHGGKIWVESEYGKGSKFKFTLHK
ncbi:hypothetical protein PbJCM13498_34660 [Prolixibacter bellariivorans]|uniref:histidine kinase n=3 Tax=Prolixibacter bellariivorans TaxID=314319 RepID=A0A5M4B454_9BACT|nr:PAS domain S-box protein [Prolixibacter bellariivorans]GET34603.1 hypothetical protein PbJCM13498_34660 [Prolixibacter bellariivorans]